MMVKDKDNVSGFPWILELGTSVIAAEVDFEGTCKTRLVLDMSNLLAVRKIF